MPWEEIARQTREALSAEEEGFEPTVAFRLRRFSNSEAASARGCTERNRGESEASGTKNLAPSGTERHRDQSLDQGSDHRTKPGFGLEELAEELLVAVADGSPSSVDGARALVAAVLNQPLVKRALALHEMLREASPLALVRALELAEAVLSNQVRAGAQDHG